MVTPRHPAFSEARPPCADRPNSRAGKFKTWMVLDPLSYSPLDRLYLCPDLPAGLDHYNLTYHPEIGTHPTEQQQKLQAFEKWARSVFPIKAPNEAEIWQVDLDPEEVISKKDFYESFYGIKFVGCTRKTPEIDNAAREVEEDHKFEDKGQGNTKPQIQEEGKAKGRALFVQHSDAMNKDQVKAKAKESSAFEWDAESNGLTTKQTNRYFVQMPNYCFVKDDLEPARREASDAFGECSRLTFNISMQRVHGVWLDFRCIANNQPRHEPQHWRAYLYELRPMRPYARNLGERDKRKRKCHPLTEEETEDEYQAKRRWSAFQQRANVHLAPSTLARPPTPTPAWSGRPSYPIIENTRKRTTQTEYVRITSDTATASQPSPEVVRTVNNKTSTDEEEESRSSDYEAVSDEDERHEPLDGKQSDHRDPPKTQDTN